MLVAIPHIAPTAAPLVILAAVAGAALVASVMARWF